MRILIAEDDLASRMFLSKFLNEYGDCDLTVDGIEAMDAFMMGHDLGKPYDLICLDIMMPKVDGLRILQLIREIEKQKKIPESKRVKIIMTTALNDKDTVQQAFSAGCEAFASKPIDTQKMIQVLKSLQLI